MKSDADSALLHFETNNGNLKTKMTKIISSLAPMAGFTDSAFRRICAGFGARCCVSEMISAMAMVMNDRKTAELARIDEGEAPVILQIFGHDPEVMARAAGMLLDGAFKGSHYSSPPAGIDINMGCPVKKIVNSGDGSALMKDIDLARRIVSSVYGECAKRGVPLSVKLRLGWDSSSIAAPEFAVAAAAEGASRVTLHTRTREQMYAPSADPTRVSDVSSALESAGLRKNVILVGNGDIESYADAERYISLGCDEVAVGRASLGNPWLFRDLSSPGSFAPPSIGEIKALIIEFVTSVVSLKGESIGIRESRGRAAHFIKGIRGSAALRDKLNHCVTLSEFCAAVEGLNVDC